MLRCLGYVVLIRDDVRVHGCYGQFEVAGVIEPVGIVSLISFDLMSSGRR
jgi:hypothetical protein